MALPMPTSQVPKGEALWTATHITHCPGRFSCDLKNNMASGDGLVLSPKMPNGFALLNELMMTFPTKFDDLAIVKN